MPRLNEGLPTLALDVRPITTAISAS